MTSPMRTGAIICGVILLLLALWLWRVGAPPEALAMPTFLGLALTIGTLIERSYKSPHPGPPRAGWVATGERFIDPETGKSVSVYSDPHTGEREYRADPGSP